MTGRIVRVMLVAAVMLTLCLPFAHATASLSLSTGINSVTITDVGNTGQLSFNGALGAYIVNVTTGLSKPLLGSPTAPSIDLNSIDLTLGSAAPLTIMFTDTNFVDPIPGGNVFLATIGGTLVGSLTYTTFIDPANAPFGTTVLLTPTLTFTTSPFSGSASSGAIPSLGTYSLTQVVTITHTGSGSTSFDASLEAVPEPSTLLLMGSGFCLLGVWRLRKRS